MVSANALMLLQFVKFFLDRQRNDGGILDRGLGQEVIEFACDEAFKATNDVFLR
jgi:hypothetical protein